MALLFSTMALVVSFVDIVLPSSLSNNTIGDKLLFANKGDPEPTLALETK